MHVCPNCGIDLQRFEPMRLGDLEIEPHQVRWKGRPVQLTPAGRIMVTAVVRAGGVVVSSRALADAAGSESDDQKNIVAVNMTRVRKAFRAIDPKFNLFESVWGVGIRWRAERAN